MNLAHERSERVAADISPRASRASEHKHLIMHLAASHTTVKISLCPQTCLKPQVSFGIAYYGNTVPFHSIRQSRVTGPPKSPQCHGGNGYFRRVPNSFDSHMLKIVKFCGLWRKTVEIFSECHGHFVECRNQNFGRPVMGNRPCRIE